MNIDNRPKARRCAPASAKAINKTFGSLHQRNTSIGEDELFVDDDGSERLFAPV